MQDWGITVTKWSLSVLWVDSEILTKGNSTDYHYGISAGNYRLVYARRFSLDRKTKKLLEPIPANNRRLKKSKKA